MTGHDDPTSAPDPELLLNLKLRVREMLPHRPRRWAWDLLDARDGSWFESMFEFDSAERAKESGLAHLDEWQRSVEAPKQAASAEPATTRVVIVSADDSELFGTLKRLVAERQRIEIIPERRNGLAPMGRRITERRTKPVSSAARARGWWVVPRDSANAGSAS